jgi:hypothetical protein
MNNKLTSASVATMNERGADSGFSKQRMRQMTADFGFSKQGMTNDERRLRPIFVVKSSKENLSGLRPLWQVTADFGFSKQVMGKGFGS